MLYLFLVILLLIGVIIFILYQNQKEKQSLLNRIMSIDYRQYQQFNEKVEDKELISDGGFTDEEEFKIEREKREKGLIGDQNGNKDR